MGDAVLAGTGCLVTGAGRDLGRAIADAVAAVGAEVVLHCNESVRGAEALRRRIIAKGGKAHVVRADLSRESQARRLVMRSHDLLGRLDILINSAGVFFPSPADSIDSKKFDKLIDLNLKAPVFCAQEAARIMKMQPAGGRIINVSSIGAFESWPKYLGYCASKAALVSATRTMAVAFGPEVMVSSVAPGLIDLPEDLSSRSRRRIVSAIPAGRLGTYEDVIRAVLYLCTATYVTGQILLVDGGATLR